MSNTSLLGSFGGQGDSSLMFRNRIINGDMRIDQRNAGAAVTITGPSSAMSVDRFMGIGQSADGVFTLQRVSDAPAGFQNSLKVTVTTADASVGASQYYMIQQRIEGYNIDDLLLGISSSQQFTLSFWAKSSVAGTFGGSVGNNFNLSCPFSYTINSANTWEYKTVTFTSPASGTWNYTNGVGLIVVWSLGMGSSLKTAAGTWANYPYSSTGAVDLISTNGATLFITGVQLEAGPTATPFERRPYSVELSMAMRYYQKIDLEDRGIGISPSVIYKSQTLFVPLRATATATVTWVDGIGTTNTGDSGISPNGSIRWRSAPTLNTLGWSYWSSATATVSSEL